MLHRQVTTKLGANFKPASHQQLFDTSLRQGALVQLHHSSAGGSQAVSDFCRRQIRQLRESEAHS